MVRPGNDQRLAAAQELLNRHLGENLYSRERLLGVASDDEAMLATWDEGVVLGAAVARLIYPADAGYYRDFGPTATDIFATHRVGSLEALAVDGDHRHQGIGRQLTLEQMSWLARHGCDVAVAVSWLSGEDGTSAGMYRELGFKGTPPVPDFYLAESMRERWTCPVCRGPCRCAAAFYWRPLG